LTQKQRIHNIRGGTLSTAHYWYIFKCPLTKRADQERRLGKEANSQEIIELPKQFALYENYPNPFNPETTITFSVPEDNADVRLEIYNMLGQKVAALLDGRMAQGVHTITWDGKNSHGEKVSAGIYVCRMTAKDYNKTIKMTFLP